MLHITIYTGITDVVDNKAEAVRMSATLYPWWPATVHSVLHKKWEVTLLGKEGKVRHCVGGGDRAASLLLLSFAHRRNNTHSSANLTFAKFTKTDTFLQKPFIQKKLCQDMIFLVRRKKHCIQSHKHWWMVQTFVSKMKKYEAWCIS